MRTSDLLRLSTDNLRRRKGRTALTVIGVVVGTCAIVVMISLGLAMSAQNEEMLASWGDLTQISVYSGGTGQADPLTDEVVAGFRALPHVAAATPYYSPSLDGTIYADKKERYSMGTWNLTGAYADALEPMGLMLYSGDWLANDTALGGGKIPVMVGQNAGYALEDTRRSLNSAKRQRYAGQTDSKGNEVEPFVRLEKGSELVLRLTDGKTENPKTKDFTLVVVGVLTTDYNKGYFTDGGILFRLQDLQKLEQAGSKLTGSAGASKEKAYDQVYIKVDEVDNVSDTEALIKEQGYDTWSMTQIREEMQKSVAQSQMILGGLAAISLLVAALNIANTMTMAIYERTREIGVMKVLGCELGQIRAMFLVESGAIGLLGGIIGVVVSFIISFIMNNISMILALLGSQGGDSYGMGMSILGGMGGTGGKMSIIPLWLVLLALAFSTLVGLLSGVVPAGRAVKISALEAIKHD